jgi:cobalt-zinc-cadmium efflux system protein
MRARMAHQHTHATSDGQTEKRLFITMFVNSAITIVEIVGGIVSGSLSLLSDAIHNFSDGIAIILTYTAMRVSRRPRTLRYTFGFKRAEILAAIINASALILISFFLIREALGRFSDPHPIAGVVMLAVAVAGLIANIAGTLLLKRGSRENINIRAAYVHLLTDIVSSVSVITGAVSIIIFDIAWIDPVLSILIAVHILKDTFDIVKDAVAILMMSAPPDVDINDLHRIVEVIPGVKNIHHVHIWQLNDSDIHLEAHIDVSDMPVSQTVQLQRQIDDILHATGRITHATLQFERDACTTKELL